MYTPGTITNSQRTPTKTNKNGAIAKVITLVKQSDTIRHLRAFKRTTNEMLVLGILCWWYFGCLKMYSEKLFNIYFHKQIIFLIFVAKGGIG